MAVVPEDNKPDNMNNPPCMTNEEVEKYLHISSTLRVRLRQKRVLKPIFYGGSPRYLRSDIEQLALKGWK